MTDDIPDFLRLTPEQRKAARDRADAEGKGRIAAYLFAVTSLMNEAANRMTDFEREQRLKQIDKKRNERERLRKLHYAKLAEGPNIGQLKRKARKKYAKGIKRR